MTASSGTHRRIRIATANQVHREVRNEIIQASLLLVLCNIATAGPDLKITDVDTIEE